MSREDETWTEEPPRGLSAGMTFLGVVFGLQGGFMAGAALYYVGVMLFEGHLIDQGAAAITGALFCAGPAGALLGGGVAAFVASTWETWARLRA